MQAGCRQLRNKGVLVTRPAHQAEGLCGLIESAGGRAIKFPCLEIRPSDSAEARLLLGQSWDLVIYVSANAVRFSRSQEPLQTAKIAAVGQGTARALQAAGQPAHWVPPRADSEALLALPGLADVSAWRILIVRGEGGRALLGDGLRQRGAEVRYAEVYRRRPPKGDARALLERWEREVQIVTATSIQVLDNLIALLGEAGKPKLCATPLLVVSDRMEQQAQRLGVARLWRADGADDENMYRALCRIAEEAH